MSEGTPPPPPREPGRRSASAVRPDTLRQRLPVGRLHRHLHRHRRARRVRRRSATALAPRGQRRLQRRPTPSPTAGRVQGQAGRAARPDARGSAGHRRRRSRWSALILRATLLGAALHCTRGSITASGCPAQLSAPSCHRDLACIGARFSDLGYFALHGSPRQGKTVGKMVMNAATSTVQVARWPRSRRPPSGNISARLPAILVRHLPGYRRPASVPSCCPGRGCIMIAVQITRSRGAALVRQLAGRQVIRRGA